MASAVGRSPFFEGRDGFNRLWLPARAWARLHAVPLSGSLFVVASGMIVSILWLPLADHVGGWLTPGDLWGTFRDAHLIGWGGEADIYQSGTGYLSPPGFPMLLAPIAMVSGALHLTESFPLYLQRPSAWLLLGPTEFLYGAVVLFPIDALTRRFAMPRGRRMSVVWCCAAISVPQLLLWGHPEDLLAVACALYALLASFESRWTKSAALLGLGVAIQPLVILVVPLVVARMPWRLWARAGGVVALPSALLLVAPAVHTWRTTFRAIIDQPTFPKIGHTTPWFALSPALQLQRTSHEVGRLFSPTAHVTAGGPERILAIGVALGFGVMAVRVRPSEPTTVWVAAVCLALRCVFESVMFPYYTVPALLLVVIGAALSIRRRHIFAVVLAGTCLWAAGLNLNAWEYYVLVTALLVAACALSAPRRGVPQQRAGDPAGAGVPLGSNGSRVAPQLGSV